MNNSRVLFIAAFFILISISSCKKSSDESYMKVAMLAQGYTFDDQSFLQSCKEGIDKAQQDFNIKVTYNIDTVTNQYENRIDNFASQNYDMIIVIGYMWNNALIKSAVKYPNTKFIIVDNELSETKNNVISIVFDVDEVAFPIGFLSAWWAEKQGTGSPITSCIGALKIPQIQQFIEPFNNGVEYYNNTYNANVDTAVTYAGDFFNRELGAELADSLINNGADMVFGVGSETAIGALLKAKDHGTWGVGTDTDQYFSVPEASDLMLTTAEKRLGTAIYNVVESAIDGLFAGGTAYHGKLENSGVAIAPFHNADALISDSIKIKIETIKVGIIDGSIETGW